MKALTTILLTLLMSMGALADERKDTRTEAECDQGPDIWDEEKQECILVGAPFAFEVFPKPMKEQEESKSFLQSVILFLPEQEGDRENWGEDYEPPVRGGVLEQWQSNFYGNS